MISILVSRTWYSVFKQAFSYTAKEKRPVKIYRGRFLKGWSSGIRFCPDKNFIQKENDSLKKYDHGVR